MNSETNIFSFDWSFDDWSIDALISDFNVFDGIDFSILYSWFPGDIAYAIQLCIAFLITLGVFKIVKHIFTFGIL